MCQIAEQDEKKNKKEPNAECLLESLCSLFNSQMESLEVSVPRSPRQILWPIVGQSSGPLCLPAGR
jgi:hypothetical protein